MCDALTESIPFAKSKSFSIAESLAEPLAFPDSKSFSIAESLAEPVAKSCVYH